MDTLFREGRASCASMPCAPGVLFRRLAGADEDAAQRCIVHRGLGEWCLCRALRVGPLARRREA